MVRVLQNEQLIVLGGFTFKQGRWVRRCG